MWKGNNFWFSRTKINVQHMNGSSAFITLTQEQPNLTILESVAADLIAGNLDNTNHHKNCTFCHIFVPGF